MDEIERERMFVLDNVSEALAESLPPKVREAIDNFVWNGIPPGGFVEAVLSNDLMRAMGQADVYSANAIGPICQYVYNAVPSLCHGSRERMKSHIELCRKFLESELL